MKIQPFFYSPITKMGFKGTNKTQEELKKEENQLHKEEYEIKKQIDFLNKEQYKLSEEEHNLNILFNLVEFEV